MTKATKNYRPTGKHTVYAVTLRGSLASESALVVGDENLHSRTTTVAYLALDTAGCADIEIVIADQHDDHSNWIARADGTILVPLGHAPVELDLKGLRQQLLKNAPLGKLLIAAQNGRKAVSSIGRLPTYVYTAEAVAACANAATFMEWLIAEEETDTGREVLFAEEVLSRKCSSCLENSPTVRCERSRAAQNSDTQQTGSSRWVSCLGSKVKSSCQATVYRCA